MCGYRKRLFYQSYISHFFARKYNKFPNIFDLLLLFGSHEGAKMSKCNTEHHGQCQTNGNNNELTMTKFHPKVQLRSHSALMFFIEK